MSSFIRPVVLLFRYLVFFLDSKRLHQYLISLQAKEAERASTMPQQDMAFDKLFKISTSSTWVHPHPLHKWGLCN